MTASSGFYRSCAFVALVVIALGAWQSRRLQEIPADGSLPRGLATPILALELSCDDHVPRWIGDQRAVQAMQAVIRIDDAFLVGYALLFLLCGALLWKRRLRLAAAVSSVCGPAAAVFDFAENQAMRAVLDGENACPEHWSLIKWALFFVALIAIAAVYLELKTSTARLALGLLAALASVTAGLEGILGVVRGSPLLIEAASRRLPAALVLGFIFFLPQHALRDGVGPWLDRLTAWKVFGRWNPFLFLSAWPHDPTEPG